MEYYGYALQSGFFAFLEEHPDMLMQIAKLDEEQQQHMVLSLNEAELCERAIHYFNNETIYLKDHMIYYENSLKKTVYTMEVKSNVIVLRQYEDNPFIPFLQRIFRRFLILAKKEKM